MNDEPFSFVDNKYVQKNTCLEPICTKTLMKYLQRVHILVEKDIASKLPYRFGLTFDGWTCDGTSDHYIAIFASWIDDSNSPNTQSIRRVLLCCGPQEQPEEDDEASIEFTALDIGDYVINQLRLYHKTLENVDFITGGNCSVNRRLARLIEKPLIGWSSHRLNLAVSNILHTESNLAFLINKVDQLMKELKH